jgi:hypothetical protein
MRTNNASALLVLEKRVLQHLVADEVAPRARSPITAHISA